MLINFKSLTFLIKNKNIISNYFERNIYYLLLWILNHFIFFLADVPSCLDTQHHTTEGFASIFHSAQNIVLKMPDALNALIAFSWPFPHLLHNVCFILYHVFKIYYSKMKNTNKLKKNTKFCIQCSFLIQMFLSAWVASLVKPVQFPVQ